MSAAQNSDMPELSVIVPVYNERETLLKIIEAIEVSPVSKEIILVDDGSTDGTRELIQRHFLERSGFKVIFHVRNQGKGQAVRTGIAVASGNAVIIQDADLEYDPTDYVNLLKALKEDASPVVYGSRFFGKQKVTASWHRFVNYFLTMLTNVLYGSRLTDMETCYKLFSTPFLKSLLLESSGFEIEVELTAKTLRSGLNIREIPIAYKGRSFHEGKKIGWKDGFKAIAALLKYRFAL